jgi:hypothetical protein
MDDAPALNVESQAVQTHLGILQSVITRMASNSASCKTWCVGLVSAVLVLVADKTKPDYSLIAVIPTTMFMVLDTYYLSLERRFRESYNAFITKLHKGALAANDLFAVVPVGPALPSFLSSLKSFSIWSFYITLLVLILLTKLLILE